MRPTTTRRLLGAALSAALLLLGAQAWLLEAQAPAQKKKPAVPPPAPKLSPAEASKTFTVPDDLALDQVLAEPAVKQPVSLSFDERGRLWVVQYRQYPHPAGLKMLSRDVYWRVVYDKIPPPPPNHFRGKDTITIHEDTDGDGVFDKQTTFLDGLNIVTSVLPGRGGVWVLNPPYLLFYPTKGDVPSSTPVVHLQGFGLEDTHSCASNLHWGPDGWIYGSHGSTVTANITRPGSKEKPIQMIGQHIWRYHPEKKRFEIFAEGGGNAFGVEIDSKGRVYSGHNGGNTRGFHYVQGGYYRKGFEKHGVLANPYTFGFFEMMKSNAAPRFSHTFVIDEAPGLPARYRGKLFAVVPLMSHVMMSEVRADRSSYQTKDLGPVVKSSDTWFRPVDIKPAPDGSLFVADFYEAKIAHLGHNDGVIDRDSGRVYRLRAKGAKAYRPADLGKKTAAELVESLRSDNRWVRETARRLLGNRRDASVIPALRTMLAHGTGQDALEALWALNALGALDADRAAALLVHPEPMVRAWVVRLIADDDRLGPTLAAKVAERARSENAVQVRSQWACSARRLPVAEGLPIIAALLAHDEDAGDIHVPLLLWWAIETHCGKDREAVVHLFRESPLWRAKIVEQTILPRLLRRLGAAGTQKDLQACTELLRLAPEKTHGLALLKGFEAAYKGRSIAGLPPALMREIDKLGGGSVAFGVRQGRNEAVTRALALAAQSRTPVAERVALIETFGEARQPRCVPVLLTVLSGKEPDAVRRAALGALQAYRDPAIGAAVVRLYPQLAGEVREAAETLLTSRKEWGVQWVEAVDAGKIMPRAIPRDAVRKLLLHRDERLRDLVRKHWGDVKGATTAEMKKEIDRLVVVVSTGTGDPYAGKKLFMTRCGTCHTLHAKGGSVGPDLTPYKRDDSLQLLLHVVNPSAEIREGYENHVVVTESGRTLSGVLLEKDNRVVVLRTSDGQKVVLQKDDVAEMAVSGVSLMPEGLLHELGEQQVRDLFAYLRTSQPVVDRR